MFVLKRNQEFWRKAAFSADPGGNLNSSYKRGFFTGSRHGRWLELQLTQVAAQDLWFLNPMRSSNGVVGKTVKGTFSRAPGQSWHGS